MINQSDKQHDTAVQSTNGEFAALALDDLLAVAAPARPETSRNVVVGVLRGWDASGVARVEVAEPRQETLLVTKSLVVLDKGCVNNEVVIACDGSEPILLGIVRTTSPAEAGPAPPHQAKITADGDRVMITAEREIVLRCGEATVILTRAGKILIRGAYVLSRSSGVNRIKGGSVQIN